MKSTFVLNRVKTAAIMFNYLVSNRYDEGSKQPILLNGLDPDKKYKIEEVNLFPGTKSAIDPSLVYSGEFLMTVGFNPAVNSSRSSVVLKLTGTTQ